MKESVWKYFGLGTLGGLIVWVLLALFAEGVSPEPLFPFTVTLVDGILLFVGVLIFIAFLCGGFGVYIYAEKQHKLNKKN